uniref:Uncharacterized protein n=1 Tax=Rhizophora mucronata TaxID=61149 RepID=A0A2P2MYT4_RHIMU
MTRMESYQDGSLAGIHAPGMESRALLEGLLGLILLVVILLELSLSTLCFLWTCYLF